LEVQIEISLPDESGRLQILGIHTAKMSENKKLAPDVNLTELAGMTKNFSGAEISGLVKAAASFALLKHTKVESMASVNLESMENLQISKDDFLNALNEVKPAYGVAEAEFEDALTYGMIEFNSIVSANIMKGRELSLFPHRVNCLTS
jgi:vesicle-fusing ATPase